MFGVPMYFIFTIIIHNNETNDIQTIVLIKHHQYTSCNRLDIKVTGSLISSTFINSFSKAATIRCFHISALTSWLVWLFLSTYFQRRQLWVIKSRNLGGCATSIQKTFTFLFFQIWKKLLTNQDQCFLSLYPNSKHVFLIFVFLSLDYVSYLLIL
jgi:hypothetical protein